MPQVIGTFDGAYRFLSNFFPAPVRWGGTHGAHFPSVEVAYQAAKCADPAARRQFYLVNGPAQARQLGRSVRLRPDWEQVKVKVMAYLLAQKFEVESRLAVALLATGDAELIEGNTWGDRFWGVCQGIGENQLGRLLMDWRSHLRKEMES